MSSVTAQTPATRRRPSRPGRAIRSFATGISAVGTKELRGRMRGRRAFAVLTIYLLLLSAFAFGIYAYLRQQATLESESLFRDGVLNGTAELALSADIGHAIFSGLLFVLTLLVLVLAPAFTTGAVSLEREKQTIDLLVTTPLSTLGMVIGKLLSALSYVFLLILASVPLMAIVFAFGGVGPEDLLRAYAVLFATAFGMGAIGLFVSALTRRTQTATVLTLIVVLALTLGSAAVHEFWKVLRTETTSTRAGFLPMRQQNGAPVAILWLNPFVSDMDLICTTAPGGYDRDTCDYVASVTGTPFFSAPRDPDCPDGQVCRGRIMEDVEGAIKNMEVVFRANVMVDGAAGGVAPDVAVGIGFVGAPAEDPVREPPLADDVAPQQQALPTFGFRRDTFWPQSALAFVIVGVVLTVLSAQLVAPTRRLRLLRRSSPAIAWETLGASPSDGRPVPSDAPVPVGEGPNEGEDAPRPTQEVQP